MSDFFGLPRRGPHTGANAVEAVPASPAAAAPESSDAASFMTAPGIPEHAVEVRNSASPLAPRQRNTLPVLNEIGHLVMDHLELPDLLRFRQTSREGYALASWHVHDMSATMQQVLDGRLREAFPGASSIVVTDGMNVDVLRAVAGTTRHLAVSTPWVPDAAEQAALEEGSVRALSLTVSAADLPRVAALRSQVLGLTVRDQVTAEQIDTLPTSLESVFLTRLPAGADIGARCPHLQALGLGVPMSRDLHALPAQLQELVLGDDEGANRSAFDWILGGQVQPRPTLAHMTHLRKVSFVGLIVHEGLIDSLPAGLRELSLVGSNPVACRRAGAWPAGLESLRVSGATTLGIPFDTGYPNLQRLDLDPIRPRLQATLDGNNPNWQASPDEATRRRFLEISRNPTIRHLSARVARIDALVALDLARMPLESLALAWNPLGSAGVRVLATSRSIGSLDISHTLAVGSECVGDLVHMAINGRLHDLKVSSNEFSDDDVARLREVRGLAVRVSE